MKRLIPIVFFLLACMVVHAEKKTRKGYEVIYLSGYKSVRLLDVERTDTATIIHMQRNLTPGTEFSLPEAPLYLSDEKQRCYPLKHVRGIKLPGMNKSPFSGTTNFSLIFAPLPKDVKVFDMRTAFYRHPDFDFWGIHASGDKSVPLKALPGVSLSEKESHIMTANTVVKGHIDGYSRPQVTDTLELTVCSTPQEKRGWTKHLKTTISEDGDFHFDVPVTANVQLYL